MNKDKIIKDLKERNDKLVDQRRQFEARLYHEQYLSKEKDKEIEIINKQVQIMEKYFELIIDLGYDYDGFNNTKDLKGLIDALCKYASLGRACNTTESIYVNRDKHYNILGEEIKDSDDNE